MLDTQRFNLLVETKGIKKKKLCEMLGLSYLGLQKKIENKHDFTANEIQKLCDFLGITDLKDKESIFFASNVDKMTTNIL